MEDSELDETLDGTKQFKLCPFCAETIRAAAVYCKHCSQSLPLVVVSGQPLPAGGGDLKAKKYISRWKHMPVFASLTMLTLVAGICLLSQGGLSVTSCEDKEKVRRVIVVNSGLFPKNGALWFQDGASDTDWSPMRNDHKYFHYFRPGRNVLLIRGNGMENLGGAWGPTTSCVAFAK